MIYCLHLQKKVLTAEFFCIILHSKSRQLHHLKKMQTFEIQCMSVSEQPAGWIEGVEKSAEESNFSVPTKKRCDELTEETGAKKIALLITKV